MELVQILRELRQDKRDKRVKPEIIPLKSISERYGKDPLPELRKLWERGLVKNCITLNKDLCFYYYGD